MGEEPWKSGRILAGRYQLEQRLGEGGMGSIWRAQHLVLAAPVAVKLLDPEIAGDADTIARFMREAQSAATLRSPHVVQIIDYGMDGSVPFMVMELLEGETLADRIKHVVRLNAAEAVRIITQVARAVQRAHDAGIVHRDLKPENVFLVHNQDEDVAKVLDFGVAKINISELGANAAQTKTGSLLGTPFYMSPEQAQGNKTVDHRSDLWALGVISFEMLTGRKPFYSDGLGDLVLQICVREIPIPSQIAPLPATFDQWFARATARDADLRFQSAREMAEALREALGIEARDTSGSRASAADLASPTSSPPVAVVSATPPLVAELIAPVPSRRRFAGGEDASHAPTVMLPSGNKPSLTIKQFGTTSVALPPRSSNASALVLAVAASALLIGIAGGVIVLKHRNAQDAERPLPVVETEAGPSVEPERPASLVLPSASAEPEVQPVEVDAGPPSARDAGVEAKPKSEERKPASTASGTEPAPPVSTPDAGWVKPDWARPDDEPPRPPPEPELPTPPESTP
jgi:eukaryotic-like serine/threonine-protein kinase